MSKKKVSYKEATTEISEIIQEIENNDVDIDLLSEKVKRVSYLLKFCKTKLYDTEQYLEKLFDEGNEN